MLQQSRELQVRKALRAIFADPVNGIADWRGIEVLFLVPGASRTERAGAAAGFELNGVVAQTVTLAFSVPGAQGISMLDMEASMATNVHLTPELASFARACVEGGLYNNVSEVVRSGLRLLKEQEERRRTFDAMIARSMKEADDKGIRTMDDVLARADAAIEAAER